MLPRHIQVTIHDIYVKYSRHIFTTYTHDTTPRWLSRHINGGIFSIVELRRAGVEWRNMSWNTSWRVFHRENMSWLCIVKDVYVVSICREHIIVTICRECVVYVVKTYMSWKIRSRHILTMGICRENHRENHRLPRCTQGVDLGNQLYRCNIAFGTVWWLSSHYCICECKPL